MSARLAAPVLLLAVVPFAIGADEENPYKKAKVGDFATYKMVTKVGGFNVEGTLTQTVTAKDDKEVTLETTGKVNNMDLPAQKQTIDLTKPFDPTKAAANVPPGAGVNVQKLKDGTEKVKVGEKTYDTKWETYKVKLNAMGMAFESDMKVWQAKELPIPIVKMEMAADVMGNKMELTMELTESGSGKEVKKDAKDTKDAKDKKEPPK
jgi:hypothetical protein